MTDPALIRLFAYSDWANSTVLEVAGKMTDEQLDRPLEIGPKPGSLRRILNHILAGEAVWLSRWQGNVENTWPNELLRTPVVEIAAHLDPDRRRALFLALDGLETQCFLTGTDTVLFEALEDRAQRFTVREGRVARE